MSKVETFKMTDYEFEKWLKKIAKDLANAGHSATALDIAEAIRRLTCLRRELDRVQKKFTQVRNHLDNSINFNRAVAREIRNAKGIAHN